MRSDQTMLLREGIEMRCSRSFAYCLCVFILATALPQESHGASQPEERQPITFKHTARGEGTAKACRKIASSDGKVVLKVEGPELKGNVRLYEVATNKPLGPVRRGEYKFLGMVLNILMAKRTPAHERSGAPRGSTGPSVAG